MKPSWLSIAIAILLPGGCVIALAIEWRRRRRERDDGQYVARINEWYAKGPPIQPLALPAVRPLQARRVDPPGARVRRFDERIHGRVDTSAAS